MAAVYPPPQAAALDEPGGLYRLIADTIPHMVWTARADGWVDFHNQRCQEYTGLDMRDFEGWGWKAMVHPEDRERCLAAWTRALQSGERYDIEYRLRRADGAYRWHHGTAVPRRDAGGRVVRWFGTCTDIEGEVRSAQILEAMVEERTRALRDAESRLRAIIENEPECVKLLDAEGRLLDMNAAGLRMIEADGAGEVLHRCIYPLIRDEHREAFRGLTERVCRGERGSLEFELVGLKGTPRWMETRATPFRDERSGETLLLAITRDVTERKQAEWALRASEERFRQLTQLSADYYWETDAQHRFSLFVAGPRAPSLPAQEVLGRARWEIPSLSAGSGSWREFRGMVEAQAPFTNYEVSVLAADDTTRHYAITGEPVFDERGAFTGYRGVGSDITARKQAERALRESERRFQQFMDYLPVQAWIRDSRFRYTYVNRQCAKSRDLEPHDMLGHEATQFFAQEVSEHFRETDQQVLRNGVPIQYIDNQPSGRWLKVKFPVPDAAGGVGVAGIGLDITDRSRLEEALRQSEERFRLFMSNLPAVAWIKDASLRYTYVNAAYERTHGHSLGEVVGKNDSELWPEHTAVHFRRSDEAALLGGRTIQELEAAPLVEGRTGQWLVVKFPLPDGEGNIGVAGMAIDISERVEAERLARHYAEEIRSLMDRLVQAQESERRRIADGLHDLIGQNLTAIGIELAAVKAGLSPKSRPLVGDRLEAIRTLLESSIGAIRGVMTDLRPPALEEFGLVPALRGYAAEFAERTGMRITVAATRAERRLARATELALFRIVQEALTNAAKHSGGRQVKIAVNEEAGRMRVAVEDDGLGFARPTGARKARRGGWGLPAMRERAEAHGGSLRIEFPGRGTRVIVEMPVGHAD